MNQLGESWAAAGAGASVIISLFVVLYQIYLYLKHGEWVSLSVIDGLLYLFRKNPPPWLIYPDDWIGVHRLLERTPLALGLFIFAILWLVVIGFLSLKLAEYQEHRQRVAEEKSKLQDEPR